MYIDCIAGIYDSNDVYSCETTPERVVCDYEFEIYKFGEGTSFINGVGFPHFKGNILYSKPGDIRFTIGRFKCRFLKFRCNDKFMTELLGSLSSGVIFAESETLSGIMEKLSPLSHSDEIQNRLKAISLTTNAINEYYSIVNRRQYTEKRSSDRYIGEVISAKEYIDKNYGSRINLDTLSKITFLSKNFLRVKFEEIIGISPHRYLEKVRLSNSKKLLSETHMTIADIAVSCGYDSQAYMNYIFKKELGTSPLAYRKEKNDL